MPEQLKLAVDPDLGAGQRWLARIREQLDEIMAKYAAQQEAVRRWR